MPVPLVRLGVDRPDMGERVNLDALGIVLDRIDAVAALTSDLDAYAPVGHAHDYAATIHGHDFSHDHNAVYAVLGHNHDAAYLDQSEADVLYAAIGHSHGSSGHVIQDEGVALTARANLNFVGAGVTVTDNAGGNASVVTIPGGGGGGAASPLTLTANNASEIPLVLKGAASQTADLQRWQNSAGTTLASINNNGSLVVESIGGTGTILRSTRVDQKNLVVQAFASQTANLTEWQDSAGTMKLGITNNGVIYDGAGSALLNTSAATRRAEIYSLATGQVALMLKGFAGQTADLQQWQDSAGSKIGSLDANGNFTVGPHSAAIGSLGAIAYQSNSKLLTLRGHASQTANLQEWQNSAGTVLKGVYSSGATFITPSDSASTALFVKTARTSAIGLEVRGLASQTANLMEFQNSSGSVLSRVDANGNFFVGGTQLGGGGGSASSPLVLTSTATGQIPLTAKAIAGQTAALTEWQVSTGARQSWIGAAGQLVVGDAQAIDPVGGAGGATTLKSLPAVGGGQVPLIIKGLVGQTANLQQWQNSDGVNVLRVDSAGRLITQGDTVILRPSGVAGFSGSFYADTASRTPLGVHAAASQTASLQEWQNSAGTILSSIKADGTVRAPVATFGQNLIDAGSGVVASVSPSISSAKGLLIRGAASQTANLTEWQDSAGNVLGSFGAGGGMVVGGPFASPTAYFNVQSKSASNQVAVLRGAASQTANILEVQNSSGVNLLEVPTTGGLVLTNTLSLATVNFGTVATAGTVASPGNFAGFVQIRIGGASGTVYKIPLYNN